MDDQAAAAPEAVPDEVSDAIPEDTGGLEVGEFDPNDAPGMNGDDWEGGHD